MSTSFYWYDLETFGKDPKTSRISQFAGVRTDSELNIVGEPLVEYCQPANDFLPEPEACLITGITPQQAYSQGLLECELIAKIHQEFSQPNTYVLGYNSLRFDDEFIRYTLFRNFYDPYAREWQHGNSRWDMIDVVRLTRALRPEGIEWPELEDGAPSNKLEHLTIANGITHGQAHDALSDVTATIAIAKLIRDKQPRLWEYCLNNRDKRTLAQQLSVTAMEPVLHVSGMYGNARHSIAAVVPVALHPTNKNGVIVYDLADDPASLLSLSAEALRTRLFTSLSEQPEGTSRIGLKTVHLNKCPVIAPLKTLTGNAAERLGIPIERCMEHAKTLQAHKDTLQRTLASVYQESSFAPISDPDQSLYSGGFTSHHDKDLMNTIHNTTPDALGHLALPFDDARFHELLFRYRGRNFPQTLDHEEQQRWQEHCQTRVRDGAYGYLSMGEFQDTLMRLAQDHEHDEPKLRILHQLAEYAQLT